jgi:transposase
MKNLGSMIDERFGVIHDMGIAPIVGAMIDVLGIPEAINECCGSKDPRIIVDTGTAVKALIINMLYGRKPLVHVAEFFKNIDCEVIFGKGIQAYHLSDDCLGKALEWLGSFNISILYSKICMRAMNLYSIIAESIHVDTTNKSVSGEYESESAKNFEVTYGDPKSKRKDLKQINIGLMVQQTGFPTGGNALSGNKSDAIWFREALEELNSVFSGDINTMPICIFDAAGSSIDTYKQANRDSVPTIIRQSDRFNMTGEHVKKAWEEESWQLVDNKGIQLKEEIRGVDVYKIRSFDIKFDEFPWRLIVVYSAQLKKLKVATFKRNLEKNKEKINKMIKKLSDIPFKTYEDADLECKQFINTNTGLSKPFTYTTNIEEIVTEKYAQKGKPTKDSKKVTTIHYHINVSIEGVDEELYQEWLKQESCFVLVSNVPKDRCSDEKLFAEYKSQWIVEEKFKFLKQPLILGPIWLQSQKRIKGLIFIVLLAVLVNMYMCYRLMASAKPKSEEPSYEESEKKLQMPKDVNSVENASDIRQNKIFEGTIDANTNIQEPSTINTLKEISTDSTISEISNNIDLDSSVSKILAQNEENSIISEVPNDKSNLFKNGEIININHKNLTGYNEQPINVLNPRLAKVDTNIPRSILQNNQTLNPLFSIVNRGDFRTVDGRVVKNPTYNLIKQHLSSLKTIATLDESGKLIRRFVHGTKINCLEMVVKIGFDPSIYLERFTPKMDLWAYGCNTA